MYKTIIGDLPLTFVVAFVVVLVFLSIIARAIRCFTTLQTEAEESKLHRPRQTRVIDPAPIDGQRRLVLIRRDEVEHLLMVADGNDIEVETDAVRSSAHNLTTTDAAG